MSYVFNLGDMFELANNHRPVLTFRVG